MNTNLNKSVLGACLCLIASAPAIAAPGSPHTLVVPAASYFSFSYGTRPGYGYGHSYRAPNSRHHGYSGRGRYGNPGYGKHGNHNYRGHNYRGHNYRGHNYRGHNGFRGHQGFRDNNEHRHGSADRHRGGYHNERQYLGNGARGHGAGSPNYHRRHR